MTDVVVYGRLDQLQQRVATLERAVEILVAATGVTVPVETPDGAARADDDPVANEVATLLRGGDRVKAVAHAAKAKKLSLVEASAYVGEVEGRL